MSSTVIKVEGLGKEYVIGARERSNETFREMLTSSLSAPIRRLRKLRGEGAPEERFWALKDVSFEVKRGEVLGIIGRNGAGKSTLLKILSRITEPSEGRVTIKGRVASLLEVGTGFHPELTGRENIYLNGAILGMTHAEIRRKFGEIVDFSGVEKFIDTPVKHYSSGMYVRLAFAVAAHLEPEILVVDEVLAVGDAEFQKKCLGKMSEVAGRGRTVLFVSHNIAAVRSLCLRAIVLANGNVVADASAPRAIDMYLERANTCSHNGAEWSWNSSEMPGDEALRVKKVALVGSNQVPTREVHSAEQIRIECEYEQRQFIRGLRMTLQFVTQLGEIAFTTTDHSSRTAATFHPGTYRSTCRIPERLLNIGRYTIRLSIDVPGIRVIGGWFDVGSFTVGGSHNGGTAFPDREWPGAVSPQCSWIVAPATE